MAKKQAMEFLKLLDTDEALQEQLREKTPKEAAEVARSLSFDITEDELTQAAAALKAERANPDELEKLSPEKLDTVVGGMFWDGELAPDGREMGCAIFWYGDQWQEKNKIYCNKMNLCDKHFHVCLSNPNRSHDLIMDS